MDTPDRAAAQSAATRTEVTTLSLYHSRLLDCAGQFPSPPSLPSRLPPQMRPGRGALHPPRTPSRRVRGGQLPAAGVRVRRFQSPVPAGSAPPSGYRADAALAVRVGAHAHEQTRSSVPCQLLLLRFFFFFSLSTPRQGHGSAPQGRNPARSLRQHQ
jgi:hypothetical protein